MSTDVSEKVDEIISKSPEWAQEILNELREIILNYGLQETVKWGAPVYTHHGNVVGIVALKNYVSLWFYEGSQLSDPDKVLIASGENTQALRQWRFTSAKEIPSKKVTAYVNEAALNSEKGIKTQKKKVEIPVVPDILNDAFKKEPAVKAFFDGLAPSYQRDFVVFITEAKREETRLKRLQKSLELMREGKDLNSKYKK